MLIFNQVLISSGKLDSKDLSSDYNDPLFVPVIFLYKADLKTFHSNNVQGGVGKKEGTINCNGKYKHIIH